MSAKTILNIEKPTTQTVSAVCALLAWKKRGIDPLPQFVELGSGKNRCVLVLSNKKDCYYVVTDRDCSCPAHNWRPGQRCKHQRKYFSEQVIITNPGAAIKQANTGRWHGRNGPIIEDGERPFAKALSSPLIIDTTPDATPAELAYWSIQHDREMWPAEA